MPRGFTMPGASVARHRSGAEKRYQCRQASPNWRFNSDAKSCAFGSLRLRLRRRLTRALDRKRNGAFREGLEHLPVHRHEFRVKSSRERDELTVIG
jgi:hypothetical protein